LPSTAGIDGTIFWTAPAGFPWEVTLSAGPVPDFSNRASDTSLGAILPQDGKLYPTRLDFRGVSTKPDRTIFDYELDLGNDQRAAFTETVSTFRQPLANGVRRHVEVDLPRGRFVWLNASTADQPPTWVAGPNDSGTLDADTKSAPAHAVLKVQQAGRRYVLHLRGKAAGADWLSIKRGATWSVVLRLPPPGDAVKASADLAVLKPFDDDPQTQDKIAADALAAQN
jgi:hypothetical protein